MVYYTLQSGLTLTLIVCLCFVDVPLSSATEIQKRDLDLKALAQEENDLQRQSKRQNAAVNEISGQQTDCERYYTSSSGVIMTPGFTRGQYPSFTTCNFTIELPDQIINLDFQNFNIEFEKECRYDSVQIFEVYRKGSSGSRYDVMGQKQCGVLANTNLTTTISAYSRVEIIFDSDVSDNYLGFRLFYDAKPVTAENCLFGPSCKFPCRCSSGCSPITGQCLNGQGCGNLAKSDTFIGTRWSSHGCQVGNVALGRSTTQIGIKEGSPGTSVLVDGHPSTCTHVYDTNERNAWVVVDLGSIHKIDKVIVHWDQHFHEKLGSFLIMHGNTISEDIDREHSGCNMMPGLKSNEESESFKEFSCNVTSRYISIYKVSKKAPHEIILCEIEVIGHKFYDVDCARCASKSRCYTNMYCEMCETGYTIPDCSDKVSIVSCPALIAPSYGKVTVPSYLPGNAAHVTCDTGYRLFGNRYVFCDESGKWETLPTCQAISCGIPPEVSQASIAKTGTKYNDTVEYKCSLGYRLQAGDGVLRCQTNGQWSGPLPLCQRVNCGLPPSNITNNRGMTPYVNGTNYNDSIRFTCNNGYLMNGSNSSVICKENGKWSGEIPSCIEVDCGNLPSIANGHVNASHTTHLSLANVICDDGYVTNNEVFVCSKSGQWAPSGESYPTCHLAGCGSPPEALVNSRVQYDQVTVGASALYICDEGYVLDDSTDIDSVKFATEKSITCQENSTWSVDVAPVCHERCGGILKAMNVPQEVTSPNYPLHYHSNRNCTWFIYTEPGSNIHLIFHQWSLENSPNCSFDYVLVNDSFGENMITRGVYCGEQTPPDMVSKGNGLLVQFVSDEGYELTGFKATYRTYPRCASSPCLNGGICEEQESHYSCDCSNTPFTGLNCQQEVGMLLQENHMIKYEITEDLQNQATLEENITIGFTTKKHQGTLMFISNQDPVSHQYLQVLINNNGGVSVVIDLGFGLYEINADIQGVDLADNQPHVVVINRFDKGRALLVAVDDYPVTENRWIFPITADLHFNNPKFIYVGNNEFISRNGTFNGCLFRAQFENLFPLKKAFEAPRPSSITIAPQGKIQKSTCEIEDAKATVIDYARTLSAFYPNLKYRNLATSNMERLAEAVVDLKTLMPRNMSYDDLECLLIYEAIGGLSYIIITETAPEIELHFQEAIEHVIVHIQVTDFEESNENILQFEKHNIKILADQLFQPVIKLAEDVARYFGFIGYQYSVPPVVSMFEDLLKIVQSDSIQNMTSHDIIIFVQTGQKTLEEALSKSEMRKACDIHTVLNDMYSYLHQAKVGLQAKLSQLPLMVEEMFGENRQMYVDLFLQELSEHMDALTVPYRILLHVHDLVEKALLVDKHGRNTTEEYSYYYEDSDEAVFSTYEYDNDIFSTEFNSLDRYIEIHHRFPGTPIAARVLKFTFAHLFTMIQREFIIADVNNFFNNFMGNTRLNKSVQETELKLVEMVIIQMFSLMQRKSYSVAVEPKMVAVLSGLMEVKLNEIALSDLNFSSTLNEVEDIVSVNQPNYNFTRSMQREFFLKYKRHFFTYYRDQYVEFHENVQDMAGGCITAETLPIDIMLTLSSTNVKNLQELIFIISDHVIPIMQKNCTDVQTGILDKIHDYIKIFLESFGVNEVQELALNIVTSVSFYNELEETTKQNFVAEVGDKLKMNIDSLLKDFKSVPLIGEEEYDQGVLFAFVESEFASVIYKALLLSTSMNNGTDNSSTIKLNQDKLVNIVGMQHETIKILVKHYMKTMRDLIQSLIHDSTGDICAKIPALCDIELHVTFAKEGSEYSRSQP